MNSQEKFNLKRLLSTITLVVIGSVVTASLTWYFLNQLVVDNQSTNDRLVNQLESKITYLSNQDSQNDLNNSLKNLSLSDKEVITTLATRQAAVPSGTIVGVNITHQSAEWAVAVPFGITYSQAEGYKVPGAGTTPYLFRKVNGDWRLIGSGGTGGWDANVKKVLSEVPTDIIPASERK